MSIHLRWGLLQREALLLLKMCLDPFQNIFPVKYARILNVIMELNWHITKHGTLKRRKKKHIYGAPRESYAFLPWLCHRLREINLGTIAKCTSHEGHFMQLFIAHAFSIQEFIMGCRPVLAIDSCHLSGPYKRALLSTIAYDVNDRMFPLALGVVSSENYKD